MPNWSKMLNVSQYLRTLNSDVTEIILDGRDIQNDSWTELSRFRDLEKLSAIDCGIRDLAGFPVLPKLRVLTLHDNAIDELTPIQQACPQLQRLGIANNFLFYISQLEPLRLLPNLKSLDLEDNDVCALVQFDMFMERCFPNVKKSFVDFYDSDSDTEHGVDD
ncbi:putative acidic leucine-rich nuclear phosphoprotein 32 family member C [Paramacrobiotus metropolitanus]|uniref:putative acidic leucine-rich nuclear phosphoprotein 32 family member C n=1 Tax=Paramacrobiotus metropolitanus TaxID=2943436 RepID=UPI002445B8FB|nr:putative acidic leucine-rich nuclear phosphoprotein 32 family member C [Paramacrobiotus metropolitanus]